MEKDLTVPINIFLQYRMNVPPTVDHFVFSLLSVKEPVQPAPGLFYVPNH